MKIVVASDHAGFALKRTVVEHLSDKGVEVDDRGAESTESVDYPDYVEPVAEGVRQGLFERGILVCGSGIGMSIAANRYPGIRAALVMDVYMAKQSREHLDANVLVLAGRICSPEEARSIVDAWLEAQFEGGRHARRIEKIVRIEEKVGRGG